MPDLRTARLIKRAERVSPKLAAKLNGLVADRSILLVLLLGSLSGLSSSNSRPPH